MSTNTTILICLVYIVYLVNSRDYEYEKGNIVHIEAFGEARCSDTSFWLKWHFWPMWNQFGPSGRVNLTYHPFGIKTSCQDTDNGDIKCDCHHGDKECILNQLQNCVIEALPKMEDHIEYLVCIQGKKNISEAAHECFNSTTLDRTSMVNCAESAHGRELFSKHEDFVAQMAPDMDWVPWIFVEGKRYKEAEEDLWQFLCDRFLEPRPRLCPKRIQYFA